MSVRFVDITGPNDHAQNAHPDWERDGVVRLHKFIPTDLLDEYVAERTRLIGKTDKWNPGWNDPLPYLRVPSMLRLATYRPLTEVMGHLIGQDVGLHLCLTGFKSTERAWHQDRYLNPEYVGERYLAAWIALDDIHPDAGPFQYVPGSHLWPVIERRKVWEKMRELGQDPNQPTWPSDSEKWVGEACQEKIKEMGVRPVSFIADKGDVLLWHASLVHRGSLPNDRSIERRALIAHYSAIDARPDMPKPTRMESGSWYFDFPHGHHEPEKSTHRSD